MNDVLQGVGALIALVLIVLVAALLAGLVAHSAVWLFDAGWDQVDAR
jgi:archaellin